jgi:hypothetical protein
MRKAVSSLVLRRGRRRSTPPAFIILVQDDARRVLTVQDLRATMSWDTNEQKDRNKSLGIHAYALRYIASSDKVTFMKLRMTSSSQGHTSAANEESPL